MEVMTFEKWLAELNIEAGRRGYAGADRFVEGTGPDCWNEYYEDGFTPAEALSEDETYA